MITSLEATGFKTLTNFSESFNKGLNVLIGPNGSGKTAICQTFGLISSIFSKQLSEYILSIGGGRSVFTLCKDDCDSETPERIICVKCGGKTIAEPIEAGEEKREIKYDYECEIQLKEYLKLNREKITLKTLSDSNRFKTFLTATYDQDNFIKLVINDFKVLGPNSFSEINKNRKTYRFRFKLDPLESCLHILGSLIYYCFCVKNDMRNSKVLNIDPHVAKQPSDILEPSELLSNGRRLANTIAEMYRYERERFDDINNLVHQICPRYKEIRPEISEDRLSRSFLIIDKNGMKCPAQSLSDGTVKIIAILTAIISQPHNTAIIEEPENYLHPWACQILIDYLRDYYKDTVCVLTTHSEIILNIISPQELIICNNGKGVTQSHRIKDVSKVEKAIRQSGFGCGFHYVAGSLGGVPE